MRFDSPGFDPEMVAVLEYRLEVAFTIASKQAGDDPDGLRRKLAAAVMEGANAGIHDPERLVNVALRALPAFRENSTGLADHQGASRAHSGEAPCRSPTKATIRRPECSDRSRVPSDDLRKRLALAIMEGADTDLGNQDELIDFALKSLPELRGRLANQISGASKSSTVPSTSRCSRTMPPSMVSGRSISARCSSEPALSDDRSG